MFSCLSKIPNSQPANRDKERLTTIESTYARTVWRTPVWPYSMFWDRQALGDLG